MDWLAYKRKYNPQLLALPATLVPTPRYSPCTPSLAYMLDNVDQIYLPIEPLVGVFDVCNLTFNKSRGCIVSTAMLPAVSPAVAWSCYSHKMSIERV